MRQLHSPNPTIQIFISGKIFMRKNYLFSSHLISSRFIWGFPGLLLGCMWAPQYGVFEEWSIIINEWWKCEYITSIGMYVQLTVARELILRNWMCGRAVVCMFSAGGGNEGMERGVYGGCGAVMESIRVWERATRTRRERRTKIWKNSIIIRGQA